MLPKEIALLGKGPSVDNFEYEVFTVGINEIAYLKQCDAAVAIDYPILKKYLEYLPEDILVFRKHSHNSYVFKNMFLINYEKHAPLRELRTGTASIFIQLAATLGVRYIHFWGFDAITGNGDYADSVIKNKMQGTNDNRYKKISTSIIRTLKRTHITPIWRHL